MKRGKLVALLVVSGLLAATAAAEAAGLTSKVSGLLRKDVKVVVDGQDSGMEPVFINGKAYLPAREAAEAFGYEVNWNSGNKVLLFNDEANFTQNTGVIDRVTNDGNGAVTIDFLGRSLNGNNGRVILRPSANTSIIDEDGRAVHVEALKSGLHVISVKYGPAVLNSAPPQAHPVSMVVGQQRLIREDVVREVRKTEEEGTSVVFGSGEGSEYSTDLVLNVGKESALVDEQGTSMAWSELKAGARVKFYFGPAVTKSIPPQAPVDTMIVLENK